MASLCTISKHTILQSAADLNTTQVVSEQLLAEDQLKAQVRTNTQSARVNTPVAIVSSLVYVTAMTNYYVLTGIHSPIASLRHTIKVMGTTYNRIVNPIIPLSCKLCSFRCTLYSISLSLVPIATRKNRYRWSGACNVDNPVFPVGYCRESYDTYSYQDTELRLPFLHLNATAIVNGFFGSCYPCQALMVSSLDCLYDSHCLQDMPHCFPTMYLSNTC